MKILQVIPYFGLGGAEIMCENLIGALQAGSNEVVVVSLYTEETFITQRLKERSVRIEFLDKKPGLDISIIGKLRKIILNEKPDVIHTHLAGLKYACFAKRRMNKKIPIIHTVHSIAAKESPFRDRIFNRIWFKTGRVIPVALSKEIRKTVLQEYGLNENQVPVVYNGIDLNKCIKKQSYSFDDEVTIIHVGRFFEEKNHSALIKAFAIICKQGIKCRLKLIGEGPLKQEIMSMADEMLIASRVDFLGAQNNVYPFLNEADIFVLPSVYEGIPLSVAEAMGTGLPIVASGVGGIPDMLENEKSALLINPDVEELADALKRLISDTDLRAYLGKNALKKSSVFSAEAMAEKYLNIYKQFDL